jgi:hypothetical protein
MNSAPVALTGAPLQLCNAIDAASEALVNVMTIGTQMGIQTQIDPAPIAQVMSALDAVRKQYAGDPDDGGDEDAAMESNRGRRRGGFKPSFTSQPARF